MSRLTFEQIYLFNLSGAIQRPHPQYMGKIKAYKSLKNLTGQDFGKDVKKWTSYLRKHPIKFSAVNANKPLKSK